MADQQEADPLRSRIVREPTVVFSLLAASLFAVSAVSASRANVVTVDRREVEAVIAQLESRRVDRFTEAERRQVEDAYIDQQVLAAAAREMGLEDDPRIDDLLAQKMLHVLSADVIQPTDVELREYFAANRERYSAPPTVTAEEIVASTTAAPRLRPRLKEGVSGAALADRFDLSLRILQRVAFDDLVRIFGTDIAERVMASRQGEWVGPHRTVRGEHWLRVVEHIEPGTRALDALRDRVRLDWIEEQETARLEEAVAELRSRYSIRFVEEGA